MSVKIKRSLRAKLVRMMIATLAFVGAVTLCVVAWMQYRTSEQNLRIIEGHIHDSIVSKGLLLTENHSLALKGLVADNAFGDVANLVGRAVKEDADVVYGLFLSADQMPWVYVSPSKPDPQKGDNGLWKETKIDSTKTDQKKASSRKVNLFGQKIHESASPVIDEDEYLGTIYYGLSLKRMSMALDVAREKSDQALVQTLVFLGILIVATTLLGLLLASRASSRITRPLGDLTTAANSISSGDLNTHVEIKSGDEIEILGGAFNSMVNELNEYYAMLEEMNASLELKVEERTKELSTRNRDMRMVLDNVNQGFITLFKDGVMSLERSSVVDEWFHSYGENTGFVDYMSTADVSFSEWFELGWEALNEGFLPLELCLHQLPKHLCVEDREFSFSYSPILETEDLVSVLVVIEDITEQLEFERKEAEQREILNVFRRVSHDRNGYLSFHREAEKLIAKTIKDGEPVDLVTLKRDIHTIKGNTALFGLNSVAKICHEIENEIEDTDQSPSREQLKILTDRWSVLNDSTRAFVKDGQTRIIEIAASEYEQFLQKIQVEDPGNLCLNQLVEWKLEPVSRQFDRIAEQAKALARRLGRGDIEVATNPNDVRLNSERWAVFWSSLTHVVRNAVDHGFEGFEPGGGKEKKPLLSLKSYIRDEWFTIEIADNGKGINWDSISKKAKEQRLPYQTKEDLMTALFADGVSTKKEVTDTSGRGVGMAALKSAIEEMTGSIELDSGAGQGTCWRFMFPREEMAKGLSSMEPT